MPSNDNDAGDLRARFLDAMSRTASSVCVVTTDGAGGRAGVTVSSMSPVSVDGPRPSLLVCLHHEALARAAIQSNGEFCVNLLSASQHAVADLFAGRTPTPETGRFEGVEWARTRAGGLRIGGALESFDCTLERSFLYGSHHIMVGAVRDIASAGNGGPTLIYSNRAYGLPRPLEQAAD